MSRIKPGTSTKFSLTRINLSGLIYKTKLILASVNKVIAHPRDACGVKDPENVYAQLKDLHKALGRIKRHYRKELKAFKAAQKS